MNEHQEKFNQRVNYGKVWNRISNIGNSVVKYCEICRNQNNIVTIVPYFVFEQYNSPYYHTFEVEACELYEA